MRILTLACLVLAAAQDEKPKHPWASFKEGAWAEFTCRTILAMGPETKRISEATLEHTLSSVTDEVAIVGMRRASEGKEFSSGYHVPRKGWKGWAEGEKSTITVGDRKLSCRLIRTTAGAAPCEVETATWVCEEVPGHVVKQYVSAGGLQTTLELVDFGLTKREKKKAAASDRPFAFDPWEAWNPFREGSRVEFEMETGGMKLKQFKTIDKKESDLITLKTEMIMTIGETETITPGTEEVRRPRGMADGECPLCRKKFSEHKDESKWSEETVKIDGKDVKCHKMEGAAKNCQGDANPKFTAWYSTEVPGHFVRMEAEQMKMTLLKFEKK